MANKDALSPSHYEKKREENLRMNKLMMEQLFGTTDPAKEIRQQMQELKIEKATNNDKEKNNTNTDTKGKKVTAPLFIDAKRNTEKLLTIKEVDVLEQFYKSQMVNTTPGRASPPSSPVRFLFDHIYISRRTSRQAARETAKKIKKDVAILSRIPSYYGHRPVGVSTRKVRQKRTQLVQTGLVNHCHLCVKERPKDWIPCSRCKQRFHYVCLKSWFKINLDRFAKNWLCPICRDFCNCFECRDAKWKRPDGRARRLRSQGQGRGSEDKSGEDEDTDQDSQNHGQRRSQRQLKRSATAAAGGGKQVSWAVEPRLAASSRPLRAATRATGRQFRKFDPPSDNEDVPVTPGPLGPKHERERKYEGRSERWNMNRNKNVDDEDESGEDGDESGEDAAAIEGDDENEYVNENGKRAAERALPSLRRSSRK